MSELDEDHEACIRDLEDARAKIAEQAAEIERLTAEGETKRQRMLYYKEQWHEASRISNGQGATIREQAAEIERLNSIVRAHEIMTKTDAAEIERLREAAQAVVDRWDMPLWKDAEPTAHVIARLRDALAPAKEGE